MAHAMPCILPSMTIEEALDVTKIFSVSGLLPPETPLSPNWPIPISSTWPMCVRDCCGTLGADRRTGLIQPDREPDVRNPGWCAGFDEVAELALKASVGTLVASYAERSRPAGQLARCFPLEQGDRHGIGCTILKRSESDYEHPRLQLHT